MTFRDAFCPFWGGLFSRPSQHLLWAWFFQALVFYLQPAWWSMKTTSGARQGPPPATDAAVVLDAHVTETPATLEEEVY